MTKVDRPAPRIETHGPPPAAVVARLAAKASGWLARLGARMQAPRLIDDAWRAEDMACHRRPLAERWLRGRGVEIGALHKPTPVDRGVSVHYVDYKTKAENVARYPELEGFEIVATDIVDDGFLLNRIADRSLDFLIANHALEHSPDPYGTLLRWQSKLRRRGVMYFALPIAEKCYDQGRPLTSLDHLLEDRRQFAALDAARILEATEGHLCEFARVSGANIRRMNQMPEGIDEREIEAVCNRLMSGIRKAVRSSDPTYDHLISAHTYQLNRVYDLHYHTFSPTSLRDLAACFCDNEQGRLLSVTKSGGGECIVVLRNLASAIKKPTPASLPGR